MENKFLTGILDPDREDEDNTDLFYDEISSMYNISEFMKSFVEFEKNEFKTTYQLFINDLRKDDIRIQYKTCRMILSLISKVIEFEFNKNPKLEDQKDFDIVYEFALFLNNDFTEYVHLFYIDHFLSTFQLDEQNIEKKIKTHLELFWILNSSNIENATNLIIDLLDGENDKLKIKFLRYCDIEILKVLINFHITKNYSEIILNLLMYFKGEENGKSDNQ